MNLKPQFLIKSGYYIVPSPSTSLGFFVKFVKSQKSIFDFGPILKKKALCWSTFHKFVDSDFCIFWKWDQAYDRKNLLKFICTFTLGIYFYLHKSFQIFLDTYQTMFLTES